jgi:hypothetical protein
MKTKPAPTPPVRPTGLSPADIVWLDKHAARRAKFSSWSKTKQRAYLIKLGTLTPDGKLNWPKMDHVPLGARE